MMPPPVSVVIVSQGRPDELIQCLAGVSRLLYTNYEIVVVADQAGVQAVETSPFADQIKFLLFNEANISAARNLGIANSSGDIVAFIDDDAIPEPTWLQYLTEPFSQANVAAVGGYVRGRNGISFQWKARNIDRAARSFDLTLDDMHSTVLVPTENQAIKTEGTNMAVRREVLCQIGGFDPGFRFFLDESDLNMRLANTGHATAISPRAQVHHAYAPSVRRRRNRSVIDLTEIGASMKLFLRKYCPAVLHEARLAEFEEEQRRRMLRQLVSGQCEPSEVLKVMAGLKNGYRMGTDRELLTLSPLKNSPVDFLPFKSVAIGREAVLAGRVLSGEKLRLAAAERAQMGETVTLFLFTRSTLYHRVRFRSEGYWEQTGGIWGRSDRDGPLVQPKTFDQRVAAEAARVSGLRFRATPVT